MVHSFELIDMSEYQERGNLNAAMLVIAIYNGSKMKEFTFGVNKAIESRKERKMIHSINFKIKIAQVFPIRTQNGSQNYLARDEETQIIHWIKPGNKSSRHILDCSEVFTPNVHN